MGLFDTLGRNGGNYQQNQPQWKNPHEAMQAFKSNPIEALKQAGYNVPNGLKQPEQIISHLMSSGQLNNNKLSQIMQMAMFKR